MSLFRGRKLRNFLTVFIICGGFLFGFSIKNVLALTNATSTYEKLPNGTLEASEWNGLFSDYVNTWLPAHMNGPLGIGTIAPTDGTRLDVNGDIKASSLFTSGTIGIGTTSPAAKLEVVDASNSWSIMAGGRRISHVDLPQYSADAATKGYVDSNFVTLTGVISTSSLWGGTKNGNIWNGDAGLGRVGIGVTNPAYKLDILHANNTNGLFIESSDSLSADNGGSIGFGGIGTSAGTVYNFASIAGKKVNNISTDIKSYLQFNVKSEWGVSSEAMRIVGLSQGNTGGYVGIGTTTPGSKLEVNGTLKVSNESIYFDNGYGVRIKRSSDSANTDVLIIPTGTSDLQLKIPGVGTNSEKLNIVNTAGTSILTALATGNVGIGTTTPGYKLDVNGTMHVTAGTLYGLILGDPSVPASRPRILQNSPAGMASFNTFQDNSVSKFSWGYGGAGTSPINSFFISRTSDFTSPDFLLMPTGAFGIGLNGNVGIGTTSPAAKLEVVDASNSWSIMAGGRRISHVDLPQYSDDAATRGYVDANFLTLTGAISTSSLWSGTKNGNIWNGDAGAGNVGIGTTNPLQKLDIAGALKLANATLASTNDTVGNTYLCDSTKTGTFRYDAISGQSYLCDGTRWLNQKNCGLMTDDEGHTYGTVQIGGQCWMTENINIGTMLAAGTTEPTTTDNTIEKWCYGSDANNCALYGGLYNWNEAMRGSQVPGARGICPSGWHIPTDVEYNKLEKTVLGVIASPNPQYVCDFNTVNTNWYWRRCADDNGADSGGTYGVGKSLKAVAAGSGNGDGNDLVGFNGKLSGYRVTDGTYYYLGGYLFLWSSTPNGSSNAWGRYLVNSYSTVLRYYYSRAFGFAVRCLRD
jgi:uncharacterized protein (TIGR02145 family)